jgi:hypothetical protein
VEEMSTCKIFFFNMYVVLLLQFFRVVKKGINAVRTIIFAQVLSSVVFAIDYSI